MLSDRNICALETDLNYIIQEKTDSHHSLSQMNITLQANLLTPPPSALPSLSTHCGHLVLPIL